MNRVKLLPSFRYTQSSISSSVRACPPGVDSATKHGILFDVVQVLTEIYIIVTKAYISSDGVFNTNNQTCNRYIIR
ncbi:hypothetical protein Hanom_Chr07g00633871 [Helianthus anomalus]